MKASLELVGDLARRAGETALQSYARVEGSAKGDQSLVTQVDRDVERFLRAELERAFPHDAVVGEEDGRSGPADAARTWYVDPVDGTTNFVHRIPFWCVAIGLVEAGRARLGAIYHPPLGELYAGAEGLAATRNGEPIRPWRDRRPLSRNDPVVIATGMARRGVELGAPVRLRLLGSSQLHFALVASGAARAGLWRAGYLWDLVAGIAVCQAAGCRVTTYTGDEPDLSAADGDWTEPWNLCVADPWTHPLLLEAVADWPERGR